MKNCENKHEITVRGANYKYDLQYLDENTAELCVVPCNCPTACFDCARITLKRNCCGGEFYQGFINCDPVVIIQDCNLEETIVKCIAIYVDHIDLRENDRCCRPFLFF